MECTEQPWISVKCGILYHLLNPLVLFGSNGPAWSLGVDTAESILGHIGMLCFAGIISKFPAILSIPSQNIPKSRDIRLFPPAAPSRCLLKLAPPTSGGSLAHVGGLWMKYAAIRSYLSVLSLLQRAGAKRKGPHLQCWTTRCRCSGGGE